MAAAARFWSPSEFHCPAWRRRRDSGPLPNPSPRGGGGARCVTLSRAATGRWIRKRAMVTTARRHGAMDSEGEGAAGTERCERTNEDDGCCGCDAESTCSASFASSSRWNAACSRTKPSFSPAILDARRWSCGTPPTPPRQAHTPRPAQAAAATPRRGGGQAGKTVRRAASRIRRRLSLSLSREKEPNATRPRIAARGTSRESGCFNGETAARGRRRRYDAVRGERSINIYDTLYIYIQYIYMYNNVCIHYYIIYIYIYYIYTIHAYV